MRITKSLVAGGISGGIIGWFLGYLRFPYIDPNNPFVPGFMWCSAIVLLLLLIKLIADRKTKQRSPASSPFWKTHFYPVLLIILTTACIVVSILLFRQNQSLKNQVTDRHADLQALSEIIEKAGSGSLVTFMQHILEELNTAMQSPAYAGINDTLIAKLSALSNSFTPYPYFEADSISARKISPERGQLLIALLLLDIDSVSLQKIKSAVSFSGANLNGANLAGVDLSGADLRGAHFKEANLKGANLNGADMSDALLLAANLDSATLISTNLKRADMRWSRHNFAQMQAANLNGALMTNAQFIHTDLYKASLQFADVSGAIFYKGNLHSADLMGTTMVKTNFTEADMDYTNLRLTNPQESIWDNTSLHKATVDSMWMQKMEQWRLIGKEAILQHYQLANDTADQWNNPLHRLNKKSRN